MSNEPYFCLRAADGRIRVRLEALFIGDDAQVLIVGGDEHIGATAFSEADGEAKAIGAAGHRERDPALEAARTIALALGVRVAVSCGIHYHRITLPEINSVLALVQGLTREFIKRVKENAFVLKNMQAIDQIREYLASGKAEEDFRKGGEYEKGMILESLEQIMDLADLADEVATRLIYRGLARRENPDSD